MSKARPPFSARGIPSSVAPTATLRRHVEALEASAKRRFEAGAKKAKVRRFKKFYDGAASWSRVERIIARVEAGEEGADARFIVTNLAGGRPKAIYEDIYCRRGCAENHIKSWKTHLAADRTSCSKATANQFRLFLHALLINRKRRLIIRRSQSGSCQHV